MGSDSMLDNLICNPGLDHILIEIFRNLKAVDMINCRLISKRFTEFIDNNKHWWILQLEFMMQQQTIFANECSCNSKNCRPFVKALIEEQCPDWKAINRHFIHMETTERLTKYVNHMWKYFKQKIKLPGSSPLHLAAEYGDCDSIELLIDTPTDFNIRDKEGRTLLHLACINGKVDVVTLLITHFERKSIDFDAVTYGRVQTLLHYACYDGSVEVIKLLLDLQKEGKLKHSIYSTDNNGMTPLLYAFRFGNKDIIEFMLSLKPYVSTAAQTNLDSVETQMNRLCTHLKKNPNVTRAFRHNTQTEIWELLATKKHENIS